jgi:hypothetical protein
MYTRAAVAVGGLFALDKSETIYYTAFEDGAGGRRWILGKTCQFQMQRAFAREV